MDFQVLKLKFHAYNFKQAFKLFYRVTLIHKNIFIQAFVRYLFAKLTCINAALQRVSVIVFTI